MDVSDGYRKDLENHMILKPLQFEGVLSRSLSPWCAVVPTVDVRTNLKAIEVNLFGCYIYISRQCMMQSTHNDISDDW